jgi:hypothetical protein
VFGEFLAVDAEVLDEIAERDHFGDFDGALDFIHPFDALGLDLRSVMLMWCRAGAAPVLVGVHGRMEGVELEFGIAKPVAEFGDLGFVAVVEMLRAQKISTAAMPARSTGSATPWSAGG